MLSIKSECLRKILYERNWSDKHLSNWNGSWSLIRTHVRAVFVLFENMAFVANMVSLVLYFYLEMHFDIPGSANTLTNLMGSTFLLSIIGAFVSDTFLSRYTTALIFGVLEVLVRSWNHVPCKYFTQIVKSIGHEFWIYSHFEWKGPLLNSLLPPSL